MLIHFVIEVEFQAENDGFVPDYPEAYPRLHFGAIENEQVKG
jgi:hypothetical protein